MKEMYPRWAKAQKYTAEGFKPVDCFAGQVRVRGKKVTREQFSVFLPDPDKKCCGSLVKSGRTDEHGHFLVEPMKGGEYFARFESNGVQYTDNFAVVDSYQRCDGTHVEVDFSDVNQQSSKPTWTSTILANLAARASRSATESSFDSATVETSP